MLVESLVVIAEKTILNHFLLVALPEELHNFVCVAHPQRLRLLQRVHKVEMKSLTRVPDQSVGRRVVLVMKSETPGSLLRLPRQTNSRVKLDTNRQVPLKCLLIVLEPHLFVVIHLVLGGVLVEKRLHIHQDVEQVVFPRSHDL